MTNLKISISLIISFLMLSTISFCQVSGGFEAKEFSKDVSLFRAKAYLIKEIINVNEDNSSTQFSVEPLAAATSGQLTTLIFDCPQKNKGGLILGFYGSYWDSKGSGRSFTGYMYKYIDDNKARKLFEKIENEIILNEKFLKENPDNNNIVFRFDDMDLIITNPGGTNKIRIFWNGFDSEWEETAFNRTKRRYEKKSK